MARVKRGFKGRRRNNKILKMAKGFHFDRRTKVRQAKQTVERALVYAYHGRKMLKREQRGLWILRISAAAKELGKSYSKFIHDLKTKGIQLNRKMLADLAVTDSDAFKHIFEASK